MQRYILQNSPDAKMAKEGGENLGWTQTFKHFFQTQLGRFDEEKMKEQDVYPNSNRHSKLSPMSTSNPVIASASASALAGVNPNAPDRNQHRMTGGGLPLF